MEQGEGFSSGPKSSRMTGVGWWALNRVDGGGRGLGHSMVASGGEVARRRHASIVGGGDDLRTKKIFLDMHVWLACHRNWKQNWNVFTQIFGESIKHRDIFEKSII